jgi:hypothetical protein
MSHVIFWQHVENLLMSCEKFSDFMESIRKLLPDYIGVTFSQKINSVIQTDSNYVELIFSPQYSHKNIRLEVEETLHGYQLSRYVSMVRCRAMQV